MPKAMKTSTAEGFVGSVFKYSISTFANVIIMALSIVLTAVCIPAAFHGQISLFLDTTNTIMTIAILGLDQALIRFYHKPPAGLKQNGLFRVCFYFSSAALIVGGAVCSTLLQRPLYAALGFNMVGSWVIPAVFLNAFFYMVARYFNVLYRMEQNIRVYTAESVLMQFFFKLFYILGVFLPFASPLPSMVVCSMVGLGGFALVFSFLRRDVLRPRRQEFSRGAYRTLLPYSLAIAPTAVFVTLGTLIPKTYIGPVLGNEVLGIYSFIYTLSNTVTLVQGGFASFWGPYMFSNYKTEQLRIQKVHNYLNLAVLVFFSLLVAFEDIGFWLIRLFGKPEYLTGQTIFPLMTLGAVFTILCETTVYGNAIARRPIFDTIGIGLSFDANVLFCILLVPSFGLYGAAVAVALSNCVMFLFRTFTAQRFYVSIPSYFKTGLAVVLAIGVAVAGTLFAYQFWLKLACCAVAVFVYCLMYRSELARFWQLGVSLLRRVLRRDKP